MSLTTRLQSFFLGAMGAVLLAFDTGLFLLARAHLHRQLDERLESAVATLCAAAEIRAKGVEWEPDERELPLGRDSSLDEVRWVVEDSDGQALDRSVNMPKGAAWKTGHASDSAALLEPYEVASSDGTWRLATRSLTPADAQHKEGKRQHPKLKTRRAGDAGHVWLPEIVLTAGLPLQPVQSTLRGLATALFSLSAGAWLLAAVFGGRLCRKALAPVLNMSDELERMSADDLSARVAVTGSGDEVEKLTTSFNDLLSRLEEAFERQRRFTGDASHQLRTPLAVMLGQVEVALRRERSPGEYQRILNVVRRRITELRQITEMLLFLSRADAESLVEHTPMDLADILESVERGWIDHDRGGDLRFESRGSGPWLIQGHPQLASQLLDILIENAAKYSPPGSPIVVAAQRGKECITLSVRDSGEGIPPDELPHIFDPFFRGKKGRRDGQQGAGLGLAIARRIAETFHAELTAKSEVGRGSCFKVSFPALRGDGEGTSTAASEKLPVPSESR